MVKFKINRRKGALIFTCFTGMLFISQISIAKYTEKYIVTGKKVSPTVDECFDALKNGYSFYKEAFSDFTATKVLNDNKYYFMRIYEYDISNKKPSITCYANEMYEKKY